MKKLALILGAVAICGAAFAGTVEQQINISNSTPASVTVTQNFISNPYGAFFANDTNSDGGNTNNAIIQPYQNINFYVSSQLEFNVANMNFSSPKSQINYSFTANDNGVYSVGNVVVNCSTQYSKDEYGISYLENLTIPSGSVKSLSNSQGSTICVGAITNGNFTTNSPDDIVDIQIFHMGVSHTLSSLKKIF